MARKHRKPEEIVAKLRQVELLAQQGKAVAEAARVIRVREPTYYRWRSEYGGPKLEDVTGSGQGCGVFEHEACEATTCRPARVFG